MKKKLALTAVTVAAAVASWGTFAPPPQTHVAASWGTIAPAS